MTSQHKQTAIAPAGVATAVAGVATGAKGVAMLPQRLDSGDSDYDNTPDSNESEIPSDPSIDPASLDAEAQLEQARDRCENIASVLFK